MPNNPATIEPIEPNRTQSTTIEIRLLSAIETQSKIAAIFRLDWFRCSLDIKPVNAFMNFLMLP